MLAIKLEQPRLFKLERPWDRVRRQLTKLGENRNSLEIGGLHHPHHLKLLYLILHLIPNLRSLILHLAGGEDIIVITCEQSIPTTSWNCLGQGVEVCWCDLQLWGAPWQLWCVMGSSQFTLERKTTPMLPPAWIITLLHFQVHLSYISSWNMH